MTESEALRLTWTFLVALVAVAGVSTIVGAVLAWLFKKADERATLIETNALLTEFNQARYDRLRERLANRKKEREPPEAA